MRNVCWVYSLLQGLTGHARPKPTPVPQRRSSSHARKPALYWEIFKNTHGIVSSKPGRAEMARPLVASIAEPVSYRRLPIDNGIMGRIHRRPTLGRKDFLYFCRGLRTVWAGGEALTRTGSRLFGVGRRGPGACSRWRARSRRERGRRTRWTGEVAARPSETEALAGSRNGSPKRVEGFPRRGRGATKRVEGLYRAAQRLA
jgi:hypothetical protein